MKRTVPLSIDALLPLDLQGSRAHEAFRSAVGRLFSEYRDQSGGSGPVITCIHAHPYLIHLFRAAADDWTRIRVEGVDRYVFYGFLLVSDIRQKRLQITIYYKGCDE